MKSIKRIMLSAAVVAGVLGFVPRAFAADAAGTTHGDKAAVYEYKATELDAVVAEHTKMRKAGITDKTPLSVRQKMEEHCDAIIAGAKKLRDDYRTFAAWHRMQAKEESGK
ncbi:MAG: hypothetical protein KBD85_00140 [Elusimicrobia bacterium]|nr:hypothetical protein [Elusimicrobiota bacterium]